MFEGMGDGLQCGVLEAAKKAQEESFGPESRKAGEEDKSRIISQKMGRSRGRKVLAPKQALGVECRDSDPIIIIMNFTSDKGPLGDPAARFA